MLCGAAARYEVGVKLPVAALELDGEPVDASGATEGLLAPIPA